MAARDGDDGVPADEAGGDDEGATPDDARPDQPDDLTPRDGPDAAPDAGPPGIASPAEDMAPTGEPRSSEPWPDDLTPRDGPGADAERPPSGAPDPDGEPAPDPDGEPPRTASPDAGPTSSGAPDPDGPPTDEPRSSEPWTDDLVAMEADLMAGADDGVMPMFPLGSVLVPAMILPLHIFEHRYRRLVRDCLSTTPEFGVVLIERGWEVGGGEVRSEVGTVALITEGAELPDGRFAIQAVGARRIRVLRWLDDAPYPRAVVEDWPDEPDPAGTDRDSLRAELVEALRRGLALQIELGDPAPDPDIDLSDDPEVASHQVAALAPIGPHDRQRMLMAPSTVARLELGLALVGEAVALLSARRDMG